MSLFIGWHGIYSEVFLRRRLLTDFRRGDLFGRCRYPLRLEKVPQISQIYTDFLFGVFCHADFADDADFLFIGWHGIYSEVFLRRRLLTDFRRGDLSGRCRYPLRLEKVPQRKICVYLWNLWDEIISTKKNLCISVKSVGRNNPHEEKSVYICEICGTK